MTNPNTAPSADSDGGAIDDPFSQARLMRWGKALQAEGNSLGDALVAYADSWSQDWAEAVAPEAKPDDKPMLIMTGAQLRAALDFVNPDAGDADQLETEVCIQWGAERTDEDGGTEPAGLRAWLADYPDEGSISLDLWGTEEPTAPPAPLPGKESRELLRKIESISAQAQGDGGEDARSAHTEICALVRAALSSPPTLEAAPADYPNLWPVIQWLEGCCDPMHAAKELRIYADRAQRSGVSADPLPVAWRRMEGQGWWVYYETKAWDDLQPLYAAAQSQPLVKPTADRKSLNAMAADLLRPYLKEGQKVIWREAFRWQDDNGVLSNHYDGMELEQLADDFGYDWRYDMNFKHAAIVWNKVAASPQHQVKKGEPS